MSILNFVNGISAIIPGGISISDFSIISKTSAMESKKILEILTKNNIGQKRDGSFYFSNGDKLKAGLYAINQGADIDSVSRLLDWKDFEGLAAEILEAKNFATMRNLILTKPRMEIDVVGVRLGIALLIDCKHWKRQSYATLENAVTKQIERTKHYVSKTSGSMALPVIVTLYNEQIDFINKVPIVPIVQLSSFIDEFYGNLDQMTTIGTNSK